MTLSDLREEIAIQSEAIEQTLRELALLQQDVAGREPTTRELAAAGLFLANFYNRIENILKRICRYHAVEVPPGAEWHVGLVKAVCVPMQGGLPALLDEPLAQELAPYRSFRHVVHHGYGFQLRWNDMLPGIEGAFRVWSAFKEAFQSHLARLGPDAESG